MSVRLDPSRELNRTMEERRGHRCVRQVPVDACQQGHQH